MILFHPPSARWLLAALLLVFASPVFARSVTDSAGRTVEVPDAITRVFAAGPPASTLLYVVAPEKIIGWVRAPRDVEKPYLLPATRDLPELGRLTGRGDTLNLERLLVERPQLVIDFGTISDTYRSLADRVQQQTGIPYLLLGLLPPLGGTVSLGGDDLRTLTRAGVARRIAYVLQVCQSDFAYTVLDPVVMGRTAYLGAFAGPARGDYAVAMEALAALGIDDLADRDANRISGGQRQLALIARALAQQAGAVIMDEPTASLDLANRLMVLGRIEALAKMVWRCWSRPMSRSRLSRSLTGRPSLATAIIL